MVARDSSHACDLCMYDVASGVNFCGKIFAIGELRYVLLSRVGFASCRAERMREENYLSIHSV